jgi:hypothetical protein
MGSIRGLLLALLVVTSACSSAFGPDEARALAEARQQWAGRSFPDYTFDIRHDCFCSPEQVGPVRITVRGGTIVAATLLGTGEAVPPANWYTIEQLFERIPLWAKEDGVDDVIVEYDATLGFPSSIEIRFKEDILDAGGAYTVSKVGPAS